MEFSRIIIKPLLTEKSYALNSGEPKQYAFEVHVKANKFEISDAFQIIYDIKPTKVNTQLRKPTKVRKGTARSGYSKLTKIAYITLPLGKDIAISSEQIEKAEANKTTSEKSTKEKGTLTNTSVTDSKTKGKLTEVGATGVETKGKLTEVSEKVEKPKGK